MVSRRKRAANRRNARKSTGPKSEEGKRKVSRNALVHGLRSARWPVLPFEDEQEYREFARAVERDYAPVGIVQRELISHITQLLWKLRRIPAIEQALLQSQRVEWDEKLAEAKDDGRIDEHATLEKTTTAELLAGEFAREDGFGYERLEVHRGRLERGLHATMRQLKKAREETCGEELSEPQQVKYAVQEFERVVEEAREIRQTEQAMKADSGAAKVAAESSMARPAAPHEPAQSSSTSKATADANVDKYWLQWEKRQDEAAPKIAAQGVEEPQVKQTAQETRSTQEIKQDVPKH